jgi:SAM-dependent methyltransferase
MSEALQDTGHETLVRIEEALGRYNTWMFEQIAPHVGDRVLEVGSGIGNMSAFMQDRTRLALTDVSDEYLALLRERFGEREGVSVDHWDLNDDAPASLPAGGFDTVICLNVLEHIREDKAALERMRELLAPGGKLVLLVPAHQLLFNGFDEGLSHFRRYDKPGLSKLLAETGFRVRQTWYFNFLGAIGWFVNGNLLRKKILPTGQMKLFDLLVPLLKLERLVPLPFGISVIAVAEAAG